MEDKILNFSEALKGNAQTKIDRGQLLDILQQIPRDRADEYGNSLIPIIDDMILFRAAIQEGAHPALVRHIIEGFSEEKLSQIYQIALNIIYFEGQREVNNIVRETLGMPEQRPITEAARKKAKKLVTALKGLKIDHVQKGRQLAEYAGCLTVLGEVLLNIDLQEDYISGRLEKISEKSLENLTYIAKQLQTN